MQGFQQLFNLLLKDIKVELDDEFDRNFERKAFFDTQWNKAIHNSIGSLLNRTGALRKSLLSEIIENNSIKWTSSLAYADIQNNGGKITVTQKMRGFFWYKYRMSTGSMQRTNKGSLRNNIANRALSAEALFWKAMALKKVGSVIVVEKRQFIGDHPLVHTAIKNTADDWVKNDLQPYIYEQLNNIVR